VSLAKDILLPKASLRIGGTENVEFNLHWHIKYLELARTSGCGNIDHQQRHPTLKDGALSPGIASDNAGEHSLFGLNTRAFR
jgi:hypothetical protein